MANILITHYCNQKCSYCFAMDKMQNKKNNALNEMPFNNFKVALNFLKKSNEKAVRLMGGEPTLHSEFKRIINYALSKKFSVQVFTNGLFPSDIARFLEKKKEKIKYSFNINPLSNYSSAQRNTILRNLKKLSQFDNCLVGGVISKTNFNINYLLELADKYQIKIVMLRISNPIIGRKNKDVSLDQYPVLADRLVREIKRVDNKKISIGLGCGFSKKMFDEKKIEILKKYSPNLRWGCDANSGRFDIGTDLSVFRCFPLSNWQKKNLSDFNDSEEIEKYFSHVMKNYQSLNLKNDFTSKGPCFSRLLIKSHV